MDGTPHSGEAPAARQRHGNQSPEQPTYAREHFESDARQPIDEGARAVPSGGGNGPGDNTKPSAELRARQGVADAWAGPNDVDHARPAALAEDANDRAVLRSVPGTGVTECETDYLSAARSDDAPGTTPTATPTAQRNSEAEEAVRIVHRDGYGWRQAMIAALGVGTAIGSVITQQAWVLVLTAGIVLGALAFVAPGRRRLLAIGTAVLLVLGGALGVRAGTTPARHEQRSAQAPERNAVDEQALDRLEHLESRIDMLLQQQLRSEFDEIPVADLAPIRAAMLEYINRLRDRRGIPPVVGSVSLERLAQKHVAWMVDNDRLAHRGSSEEPFRSIRAAGFDIGGQVIAAAGSDNGSWRQAVEVWLRSSGHRSLLLGQGFTHIGVGVGVDVGKARGRRAGYYAVNFGGKAAQ